MKVGFAVQRDEGLESQVYNHFGSAPMFLVVETGAAEVQTIHNQDLNHSHGACSPMKALGGQQIDALVVGGIGGGALMRLNAMGVKVYSAEAPTIRENLQLLSGNRLPELSMNNACQAHEGGCGSHEPGKNKGGFPVIK
jgi:predicted Fe-Mo cluster-binding NifX family protein